MRARTHLINFIKRYYTYEIWKTFRETTQERAKYLRNLLLEHVQNFKPIFYLDIGAGLGYNTLIFGQNASEILAMDLKFPKENVLKDGKIAQLIVADARFLPLKNEVFDSVSLISVIEHITNQNPALKEAWRVLKSKGTLIIQMPNKFFPFDLHSGLPLVFFIPSRIRRSTLGKIGYEWLEDIKIPSKNEMWGMIWKMAPKAKVAVEKVIYPPFLVLPKLQPLYRLVQKLHILNFIPIGYLFIVEK